MKFQFLERAVALAGSAAPRDPSERRLKGMMQGFLTSIGGKALTVVISFISVPLTIHYLGVERYGAWIAIGSMLSWLTITDFGFGNGLNNAMTTAAAQDDHLSVRTHLSNYVAIMSAIAAVVALGFLIAWPFIRWDELLGVHSPAAKTDLNAALVIAIAIFIIRMPTSISGRVFNAYQEGKIGNYWGYFANIASLGLLLLITRSEGGLPLLVLAVSGIWFFTDIVGTIWLFTKHRPEIRPSLSAVDRQRFKEIMKVGVMFFALQIMALITFQTDTLIVAHFLGAADVPQYNLTLSFFGYAALPQTILFGYLWSSYNDAIARNDAAWVNRAFAIVTYGGTVLTAAICLVLFVIAKPFITWWTGGVVVPTTGLMILMGTWTVINVFTNSIAALLAAASRLKYQIVYSAVATVSNIALSLYGVKHFGAVGVIGATVASYLVFVCIPSFVDVKLLLRGLWEKDPSRAPAPAGLASA